MVVFLEKNEKKIEIYDIRNEASPLLDIQLENDIQKIEFNPYEKNELMI